jgi:alpha-galactosidase
MNTKIGLMTAMTIVLSFSLFAKDYLISTSLTSLLISAEAGREIKDTILWSAYNS